MRQILAILTLCTSLCAADPANGPMFGIWHIDGHGYAWQQAQIDAGYPIETSIRIVATIKRNIPKQVNNLNDDAPLIGQMDGGLIVLRMNNIGVEVDKTIPRIDPLTESNWQASIMCVRRLSDGTLDQTPYPDPFGPHSAWAFCGDEWATSDWMTRLQEIVPNPTSVILRQNNEGPRIKWKFLVNISYITEKIDGVKVTRTVYSWKDRSELEGWSIRIADWVDARRANPPEDHEDEFYAEENARYQALFDAFDAASAAGWQGKLRTVGYGGFDENRQHDAASVSYYPGWYTAPVFTASEHAEKLDTIAVESQAKEWTELSVGMFPQAVTEGALAGEHAVVDPESFGGFFTHIAWRLQSPGREVRLTYWDNYNTPPEFVLVSQKPQVQDALTALGREDLLTATVEDYELALMQQLRRIHDHAIIGRYWREGTTTVLDSPLNDEASTRVYATETVIPGEPQTLLCVYTPCDLTGEIDVGGRRVPAKRLAYYLSGLVEITD